MRFILLCLSLIAAGGVASAQQAAVSGVVKDPSGGVVPGAKVTIVKTDTATRIATLSSETGLY